MDNVIGPIEGTATFKHVSIYRKDESVRVLGTYIDDDTTLYEAPPGSVRVGGLEIVVGDDEAVTLTPCDGNEWVWVEATETELHITKEKRENE